MAEKTQTILDTVKVSMDVRAAKSDDAGAAIIEDTILNFKRRLETIFNKSMQDKKAQMNKRLDELVKSKDQERDLMVARDQAELKMVKIELEIASKKLVMCEEALDIARVDKFEMQNQFALEQRENYELQRAFRDEKRAAKVKGTTSDPAFSRMVAENRKKDEIIDRVTRLLMKGDMQGALDVVRRPDLTRLDDVDATIL